MVQKLTAAEFQEKVLDANPRYWLIFMRTGACPVRCLHRYLKP